ncbi:toprim domain-containing protein [Roseomonas sp. KE0001]|uniref:toprim domain-containing protein n=1 Tax=Roseomonas sp. KE0001 TaxID=2479201 RepID=UPI0018DF13CC|nr:toprim domain-containing protein [Roseomonas sp. KE0001]MBI0436037.1 hypothetical protein [Roseomonas sp. KE0001]
MQRAEVETEFADELHRAGFTLNEPAIMDGQWHRGQVDGDRGAEKSGRYVGYTDGHPAGFLQNFRTGYAEPWKSSQPMRELTEADRQRIAAARTAREAERKATEERIGKQAFAMWMRGTEARDNSYLSRKGVLAHGMRQDNRGKLLVPVKDEQGWIRNLQIIDPDGRKLFLPDGRTHGLFTLLGAREIHPARPLLVAEGFATAAAMREMLGQPVAIAFNSGNLLPVAQALQRAYPGVRQVFAADNDHHLPRREKLLPNVGKEKATEAANAVGGLVLLPEFAPHQDGTDWLDFADAHGREVTRQLIRDALRQEDMVCEPLVRQPWARRYGARPAVQAQRG